MHDIAAAMHGIDHCGSRETRRRRAATRAAPTGGVSPPVLVMERAACALVHRGGSVARRYDPWIVIVEPDAEARRLVVVTVYEVSE
jgi:hypothetical protein